VLTGLPVAAKVNIHKLAILRENSQQVSFGQLKGQSASEDVGCKGSQ
jgi:hypothetical protein